MTTKLLSFAALVLILISCAEPEAETTQDPTPSTTVDTCVFENVSAVATVTEIMPIQSNDQQTESHTGEGLFHIQLSFDQSDLSTESQYLNVLLGHAIDSSFIAKHELSFGTKLDCQVKQTVSGDCKSGSVDFGDRFQR